MASLEEYLLLNMHGNDDDSESDGENPAGNRPIGRISHGVAFAMSETKFKKNYRLTKGLVRALIEELRPFISAASRLSDLTVETKVLVALNFFAVGSYQTDVGNQLNVGISQASVSKCITEVVTALNHPLIMKKYVKFPRNNSEMDIIAQKFYNSYGLPGVVGCIDCTHVAIYPPPNDDQYDERSYVNRKGYHSINTQLICDADLYITNVNPLFPGCTHDNYIWNQSAVQPVMQEIYQRGGRYYLIGDSGYALRPWLQVPIPEPCNRAEERYNDAFKTARATIERCNGVLKGRFRCLLKHRVLHYSPEKASKIINSCVVLHNMCITNNVQHENDDSEDENVVIDYGLYDLEPANSSLDIQRAGDLAAGQNLRAAIVNNYFS